MSGLRWDGACLCGVAVAEHFAPHTASFISCRELRERAAQTSLAHPDEPPAYDDIPHQTTEAIRRCLAAGLDHRSVRS